MMKEDNDSGWQSEKNQEGAGQLEAGALQPACFWISGGCAMRGCRLRAASMHAQGRSAQQRAERASPAWTPSEWVPAPRRSGP